MDSLASSYVLLNVFVFLTRSSGQESRFDRVEEGGCDIRESVWHQNKRGRNCSGETTYHCVSNENSTFGEVCAKEEWVQPGYCPQFNTKLNVITGDRMCSPFDGHSCPVEIYSSSDVHKHKPCLGPLHRNITETKKVHNAIIVVPVIGLAMLGVIVACLVVVKQNKGVIPVINKRLPCYSDQDMTEDSGVGIYRESIPLESKIEDADTDSEKERYAGASVAVHRSNPCFVETSIYKNIIYALEKEDTVLIVGETCTGKTATCVGVLEYYRDIQGWNTIDIMSTNANIEIEDNTVVLLDCCCGDLSVYDNYSSKVSSAFNIMFKRENGAKRNTKLIVTSEVSLTEEFKTRHAIPQELTEIRLERDYLSADELEQLHLRYTKKNDEYHPVDQVIMYSEARLPLSCFICGMDNIEIKGRSLNEIMHGYLECLKSGNESKQYTVLVLLMLNGGSMNSSEFPQVTAKKLRLNYDEMSSIMREMTKKGLLYKLFGVYKFSNDLLLRCVLTNYATNNLVDFINLAYFPLLPQFLRPVPCGEDCFVEIKDNLSILSAVEKRWSNEYQSASAIHPLLERFKSVLNDHEQHILIHNNDKWSRLAVWTKTAYVEWESGERRFVRNMIQYHPYLESYYQRTNQRVYSQISKDELRPKTRIPGCCKD